MFGVCRAEIPGRIEAFAGVFKKKSSVCLCLMKSFKIGHYHVLQKLVEMKKHPPSSHIVETSCTKVIVKHSWSEEQAQFMYSFIY